MTLLFTFAFPFVVSTIRLVGDLLATFRAVKPCLQFDTGCFFLFVGSFGSSFRSRTARHTTTGGGIGHVLLVRSN